MSRYSSIYTYIYCEYMYMVNLYMLIALWCMHTVLCTYLPYGTVYPPGHHFV